MQKEHWKCIFKSNKAIVDQCCYQIVLYVAVKINIHEGTRSKENIKYSRS